jgi:hypothetical protein
MAEGLVIHDLVSEIRIALFLLRALAEIMGMSVGVYFVLFL